MALSTGNASGSHDHFSAKFGLRRLVYVFYGNLHVLKGSVLKKTDWCRMCSLSSKLIYVQLYNTIYINVYSKTIWKFQTYSLSILPVLIVYVYHGQAVWRSFCDRYRRGTSAEIFEQDTGLSFLKTIIGYYLIKNGLLMHNRYLADMSTARFHKY